MTLSTTNFHTYTPPNVPTYTVQAVKSEELFEHSTFMHSWDCFTPALNERILRLLEEFKKLNENWDRDGALAPDSMAIRSAEMLVKQLQLTGQKVFHVAPGPQGEIMIDLRKEDRSVEILFYADKMRYVLFPKQGSAKQSEYKSDDLPKILKWLHE